MENPNKLSILKEMPEEIQRAQERFDELYFSTIHSISPTITKAVELLHQQTSKQIRPLLLTLVAGCYREVTEEVINGAVFIELLHVATLAHDDVIDESGYRRGVPSLNAIFDNHKAVLIGDYLLANAMVQAVMTNNQAIVLQLAKLGKHLSEGEILQMDTAELGDYSEERYLEIIDRKTASLIESSMMIGAILAGQEEPDLLRNIQTAGQLIGRAFQIRDDIFDYQPTKSLGKPSGQDIAEHKVTLPLIYALDQKSKDRDKVLKLLRHEELKRRDIQFIIDYTIRMGGINYATQRMEEMVTQAKALLIETLPDNENRDALLAIADYIVNRKL
ncbi:MAG: polyprenyl synthetase family protein [Porphyromonas sp.]|nr:polyprenyl synthetase family protein [Porphyromonas sp.]